MSFVLRKVIWCFTSQVDLAQIFNLIIVVASQSMHAEGKGMSGWEMQKNAYGGWVGKAFETVWKWAEFFLSSLSSCFIFGMWSDIIFD